MSSFSFNNASIAFRLFVLFYRGGGDDLPPGVHHTAVSPGLVAALGVVGRRGSAHPNLNEKFSLGPNTLSLYVCIWCVCVRSEILYVYVLLQDISLCLIINCPPSLQQFPVPNESIFHRKVTTND